jgi:hypothetical protein
MNGYTVESKPVAKAKKTEFICKGPDGTVMDTRTTFHNYKGCFIVKTSRERFIQCAKNAVEWGKKTAAEYAAIAACGTPEEAIKKGLVKIRRSAAAWDTECVVRNFADGDYKKWAADYAARIPVLEAELEKALATTEEDFKPFVRGWTSNLHGKPDTNRGYYIFLGVATFPNA